MWVSDMAWISSGQTLLLLLGNERRQDDQPFAVSPQLRRAGHDSGCEKDLESVSHHVPRRRALHWRPRPAGLHGRAHRSHLAGQFLHR